MNKLNRRQFIKTVGVAAGGTILFHSCDFFGDKRIMDSGLDLSWLDEAGMHVLTPKSRRVLPVTVAWTEGEVVNPEAMLSEDGNRCHLEYREGEPAPVVVLDFGAQSLGGYAVFKVVATHGQAAMRLAYACHPDGLSETGCFSRETSARYLGPDLDLPVLPGNVNRHEVYSLPRTGIYIAPLIQGQTRYVRVQLDTPGTAVDLDTIIMVNSGVYDDSPHDGFFLCSDERLNRLWYISTWTMQIASLPEHNAFKTVEGWLLPRKLEHASDLGLSVAGNDWNDVIIETVFEIRANPHYVSSAGLAFRAKDPHNAYMIEIGLDNSFRLIRREQNIDVVVTQKKLDISIIDGLRYSLIVKVVGSKITTSIDGIIIDESFDQKFQSGRVGFFTPKEKWPLFQHILIKDADGTILLQDDFSGDLSNWSFARTLSFIADGAKRDRLVWSGDLYFAQRNAYYAFSDPSYMRDSLLMLAFNQTPDGFIHAAPYPEISIPPKQGDYGHFQSDEFATWLIPVAWDHLLYTNDKATLQKIWPAIEKLVGYLESHMDNNGLFLQRYETSKHAGNLNQGDVRRRSYMNILLWAAFRDAANISEYLEIPAITVRTQRLANKVKEAVMDYFWDDEKGFFKEAIETPQMGFYANALALSMKIVNDEQAERIAPHLSRDWHGKFQSLASRGKFEYGFGHSGLQAIFEHNWLRLLEPGWKGATTTHECMTMITNGWGDESHPDTAIAGIFSAYILGVAPIEPGYRRFRVKPLPVQGVNWAKGIVPVPGGTIHVSWQLGENDFSLDLYVPEATVADVELPIGSKVYVNGKLGNPTGLVEGNYKIELKQLPAEAWVDHTVQSVSEDYDINPEIIASSSIEGDGWSKNYLFAPVDDKTKRGYSSSANEKAEAVEWLEIDFGKEISLSKIVLLPRSDSSLLDAQPAGFPRDFTIQLAANDKQYTTVAELKNSRPEFGGLTIDLYTVIGYPTARYVKLLTSRLGNPAIGESGEFRLQLERILLVQP